MRRTRFAGVLALVLIAASGCDSRAEPPLSSTDLDCAGARCDIHARCSRESGAPRCVCEPGYRGEGQGCEDVDECAVDNGACGALRSCENTPGSFRCGLCPEGFELGASQMCIDVDECASAGCDPLVACDNTPGGFRCGSCPQTHWGSGLTSAGCIARVSQAAAGSYHTCALLPNGSIKCWGNNLQGELGLGDRTSRGARVGDLGDALAPVDLGTGLGALTLTAGEAHSCALLEGGRLKCWGANDEGQLGLGDRMPRGDDPDELGDALPAVELGSGMLPVALASGSHHTCALLEDGSVKCWGGNTSGQLGLGDTRARGVAPGEMGDALPALSLGQGSRAVAIAAGGSNTCVVLEDGSLKCWGGNEFGQLGLGDTNPRGDEPAELPDRLPAIALGSGRHALAVAVSAANHVCALLDDRTLKCWGANTYGELGLGDTLDRGASADQMGERLPGVELGTGRHAIALALGGGHSCAVLDDHSAKCWGYNEYAALGLEDFHNRGDQPGEMGDALPAISLGAGLSVSAMVPSRVNHSCAVLHNGAIKCWGSNSMGQLGHGTLQASGGRPGEMGDRLPVVNLGHVR